MDLSTVPEVLQEFPGQDFSLIPQRWMVLASLGLTWNPIKQLQILQWFVFSEDVNILLALWSWQSFT